MIKIYNSGNLLETNQILAALEQNHIAAHGKEVGANSYMKIAGAMSVTGTDIYVSEQDAPAAKEIIESITGEWENTGAEADDEAGGLRKYEWKRRLFAIIMLMVLLAALVAGMFFSN